MFQKTSKKLNRDSGELKELGKDSSECVWTFHNLFQVESSVILRLSSILSLHQPYYLQKGA